MRWWILFFFVPAVANAIERFVLLRSRLPPPQSGPVARFPTKLGWGRDVAEAKGFVLVALGLIAGPLVLILFGLLELALPKEWRIVDTYPASLVFLGEVMGVWLAFRLRRASRERGPKCVELFADRLIVPVRTSLGPVARATIPLVDLRALNVWREKTLIVSAAREAVSVRAQDLAEPASLRQIQSSIEDQIKQSPDGTRILAGIARDAEATQVLLARPVQATNVLAGLLIVIFVLQWVAGFSKAPTATLFRMGANSLTAVQTGAWFRLFTANFLHAGVIHILSNLVALSIFGGLLERVLGSSRLLVVYLGSGLSGAALSSRFDSLAVGASTSVFGLIAGLAVVQALHGSELPTAFRLHSASWATLVGVNAALPLVLPNISWAGHLGGALGGATIALLVARPPESLNGGAAPDVIRALAVLLVILHVAAFGQAINHARQPIDFEKAYLRSLCAELRHAQDPTCAPGR